MANCRVLICVCVLAVFELVQGHGQAPKVCGQQMGCVHGIHMPGYQIAEFEAFLGLPYALPPIGELRFAHPKPYPKLKEVYNATVVKPDCIQKNYMLPNHPIYGKEDCLYLNVYRPILDSAAALPVMVYIHGGGFFTGSPSPKTTGPEYFMDSQQVIVVVLAYRLGSLGFLSTDDANIPGNLGLKDQNLALRWVQQNIAAFGGDPQQVTIFGQSAGAVSVHMHVLSKQSTGLFRNAISISGTANVPFAITNNPLEQARELAKLANISNAYQLSTAKLAHALRSLDIITLINAGDGLKFWDVDPLVNFRPIVEHGCDNTAFLSEHPKRSLATGNYQPVPMLFGFVPEEGSVRAINILTNHTLLTSFNKNFERVFKSLLDLPEGTFNEVINEYLSSRPVLNNHTLHGFIDIMSDRAFKQPLFAAIESYVHSVDTANYPIYVYKFNYSGPLSYVHLIPSPTYGVAHCDDLIYLFRSPTYFTDYPRDSPYAQVIKSFVDYFVHFAKHSKPIDTPKLRPCNAAAFNRTPERICDYHLFVNSPEDTLKTKTVSKFNVRRMNFWRNILDENNCNEFNKCTVSVPSSSSCEPTTPSISRTFHKFSTSKQTNEFNASEQSSSVEDSHESNTTEGL